MWAGLRRPRGAGGPPSQQMLGRRRPPTGRPLRAGEAKAEEEEERRLPRREVRNTHTVIHPSTLASRPAGSGMPRTMRERAAVPVQHPAPVLDLDPPLLTLGQPKDGASIS